MATKYHSFSIFMNEAITAANESVDLEDMFTVKKLDMLDIQTEILAFIDDVIESADESIVIEDISEVEALELREISTKILIFMERAIDFDNDDESINQKMIEIQGFSLLKIAAEILIKAVWLAFVVVFVSLKKELPLTIKEVSEEYYSKWQQNEGNKDGIDDLVEELARTLIWKARVRKRKLFDLDRHHAS